MLDRQALWKLRCENLEVCKEEREIEDGGEAKYTSNCPPSRHQRGVTREAQERLGSEQFPPVWSCERRQAAGSTEAEGTGSWK